jgi:hypothetical protein
MTSRAELTITERVPFAEGREFGAVGVYERLTGRAHFAVDPGALAHHGITDIDEAAADAEGLVRFTGDFSIPKPIDPRALPGCRFLRRADQGGRARACRGRSDARRRCRASRRNRRQLGPLTP